MDKNASAYDLGVIGGFTSAVTPPNSVFEKLASKTGIAAEKLKEIFIEKKAIHPLLLAGLGGLAAVPVAKGLYHGIRGAWSGLTGNNPYGPPGGGRPNLHMDPWQQRAMANYDRNAAMFQQAQMLRDSYNPQVSSPFGPNTQG